MKRLVSTLNLSKEDWLRYRKCGITGTDAGAILGLNPYRSAFQVYHDKISDVVFAPKYRRMVIYGQIKKDIGQILRQLCEQKGIEIIEAEACPDHIHILISFSPKYSISYVMGYLKGKSSLMIFDRHANLKYKYGNRHFWARGYFVDTVRWMPCPIPVN